MKTGKNYRLQPACDNCKKCILESQQDDPDGFFCNKDGTKKPPTDFKPNSKWNKWIEEHIVQSHGICDEYEKMESKKKFVILEGLKERNRFYTTNGNEDPTRGNTGEVWYKILGYVDTPEEAVEKLGLTNLAKFLQKR